ncbi:MAG: hypothetical protein ACLFTT_00815 [Candidatus Hydrogenedentota bacterium]
MYSTLLLNIAAATVAVTVILAVWSVVHLFARKRIGERKLGCRGGSTDAQGNYRCCKGDGSLCDSKAVEE